MIYIYKKKMSFDFSPYRTRKTGEHHISFEHIIILMYFYILLDICNNMRYKNCAHITRWSNCPVRPTDKLVH